MRILIQRVKKAGVTVNGAVVSRIEKGLLVFVGIGKEDGPEDLERLAGKLTRLRIFEDEQGKMNLDIKEVKGSILSVSQFTLYGDTKKGNRPGFDSSAQPDIARGYWTRFNEIVRETGIDVKEGVFGAHMEIDLVNDGPVTIWIDSKK